MSEAAKIVEKYEKLKNKELADLRRACPHASVSDWIDEWWALAHGTGYQVKCCERCGKEMSRKTHCTGCSKEIVDKQIVKRSKHFSGTFCRECVDRLEKEYAAKCHAYHEEPSSSKDVYYVWDCELPANHEGLHRGTRQSAYREWSEMYGRTSLNKEVPSQARSP